MQSALRPVGRRVLFCLFTLRRAADDVVVGIGGQLIGQRIQQGEGHVADDGGADEQRGVAEVEQQQELVDDTAILGLKSELQ